MSCDNPLLARFVGHGEPLKIYGHVSEFMNLYKSRPAEFWILVPCGKCLSCRMSAARMWSVRCAYELQSCGDNACFITLTYNNDHLPVGGSLVKRDYQLFLKRLRKYFWSVGTKKIGRRRYTVCPYMRNLHIRFFGCGEYGSKNFRPHFHIIVFGWKPYDLEPFFVSGSNVVYRSALLDRLWSVEDDDGVKRPLGFVSVGAVSEDSVKYVCRYTLKKIEQDLPVGLAPSFTMCSSRPAIGLEFFRRFWRDFVVKDDDGAILRYGCPDPFNPGSFIDVRFFRKIFRDDDYLSPDEKIDLRNFFIENAAKVDDVEVHRREEFSKVRRSHNTHYGRILPGEVIEEIRNASVLCP